MEEGEVHEPMAKKRKHSNTSSNSDHIINKPKKSKKKPASNSDANFTLELGSPSGKSQQEEVGLEGDDSIKEQLFELRSQVETMKSIMKAGFHDLEKRILDVVKTASNSTMPEVDTQSYRTELPTGTGYKDPSFMSSSSMYGGTNYRHGITSDCSEQDLSRYSQPPMKIRRTPFPTFEPSYNEQLHPEEPISFQPSSMTATNEIDYNRF
ncbi:uncharacterized protein [Dysidea avara]|uniref:uncharacterized protein isoform X2 n=1 Tax=Dysidea avara TaxID=196820 RepID=UPI00333480BB